MQKINTVSFISLVFSKILYFLFLLTGKVELYRLSFLSIGNIWKNNSLTFQYDRETNEYS